MNTFGACPSATISYANNPFCTSVPVQSVTLTGTSGGVYSSTSGLTINSTSGAIKPISSTAGTYTVTYTIAAANGCPQFVTTTSVTITTLPTPAISYSGTPFCNSITSPQSVTLTGANTGGGVYSSTTGLTLDASTGAITPSTSTAGTYVVKYTIAASGGCAAVTANTSVTIGAAADPSTAISYANNPFCTSVPVQAVTRTGTSSGGVYSSTAGLTINSSSGAISPPSSTAGTYTVTYTTSTASGCAPLSATTSVTITTLPTASISYSGSPFCTSVTSPQAVALTGTSGGVYSSAAGLSLNASTGAITPSTSTAGTYSVKYTIAASGGCAAVTANTSVTIGAAADPSTAISYANNPFCTSVPVQAVTRTGTSSGGVYSSTAGLTINSSSGAISPPSSTAGTYTVTYTTSTASGCAPLSATTSVTITALPTASISYSGTPFCNSVTSPQAVTLTGTSGGTYSLGSLGLTLNTSTGAVTPSTSTVGTYTVKYTIPASGGCAAVSTTTSVKVSAAPNQSTKISYSGGPFCTSATTKTVTLTGTSGGVYSSTAGLSINSATGLITPSASTGGTYTVTYTIPAANGCSQFVTTTPVTITTAPTASISYSGTPFCTSLTSPQAVTLSGTSGGTYSSTAGLSLNASTGAITPSTSTAGTYTVTYTIAASGGCSAVTATASVTITTLPTASISYSGTPFCSSLSTPQSVTVTGTSGGIYSSTAGLSLDAGTGAIIPSTSTAGTYTVTYSVSGAGCGTVTATTSVTITTAPSASISYAGSPFCTSVAGTQSVSFTGTLGGTFSSTSGLTIDPATGAITPSTSAVGTYTVTYNLAAANGCSSSSYTTSVGIISLPVVSSIVTDPSGYCPGDAGISFTATSANTDSYVWTTPTSLVITSGANTSSIVGDFQNDYTGGSLSVAATNVCGTTTVNAAIIVSTNCDAVWNGSLSNVWGVPGNWTPARVPGNITPVSIPSGTTYSPTLNNSTKSVGKITIDAGATVTLSGTSVLSVYDDFTNNGTIVQAPTTTLLFTSAGNQSIAGDLNALTNVQIAPTGTATLQSNWTLAGAIRFVKGTFNINGKSFIWNFDAGARVDFVTGDVGTVSGSITVDKTMPQYIHYIASPLSGVNGSQIADNVQVVSGSTSRLYAWNFGTQAWVKQLTPSSVSLDPSLGARMYFPDAAGDLIDFTGTYNHTASYTTSAQSNAAAGKFILAGNPYPSVLDWEAPVGWTFNNVDATIYYWSQSAGTIATYTRGTGVSTNGGGRYIPIMQSFFLTTTGSGGTASLGIANNTRTAQTATMYRTATNDNILSISVKGIGSNTLDETVVYLSDDATDGFDGGLDAYKMKNDSIAPNLYTKLNDIEYAVNAVPSIDRTIPLSLTVPANGNYALTVPANANAEIVLIDKLTKKQKTVDGTPYNFSASTSDTPDRFELQLRTGTSSNTSTSTVSQSVSFASNGPSVVLIAKNDMGEANVTIYNALGVEVAKVSGVNVSAGSTILNGIALQSGSYIVKVQNNDNQYTGHVSLVK